MGLIPSRDGGDPGVWTWDASSIRPGEDWRAYCQRVARETLDIVSRLDVEEKSAPAVAPYLWFHVGLVGERESW
jgi:hypothetical protein